MNTSITYLILLISICGILHAEDYSSSELVQITVKDRDIIIGKLEKANNEFMLVYDCKENGLLLIPRSDIELLEVKYDRGIEKPNNINQHQDMIEFVDGQILLCHILDMTNDTVSYYLNSQRLVRNRIEFNEIRSVFFHGNSITIPHPSLVSM